MGQGDKPLPYGRQEIGEDDITAVSDALRSAWLTTGPLVSQFEDAFAAACGARFGVAVNSGTAALHVAMRACGVGPGHEVIVPALTFAASGNAAIYEGAAPVVCDVAPDTLLIDPEAAAAAIGPRTRAIVAVDYAGQPADYDALRCLAERHGLALIADSCHAPGAHYKGRSVGTLADATCFSFHPVKHLTTAEGGMALTQDEAKAAAMRRMRNHGISTDHHMRAAAGRHAYDMTELGFNYRLPDVLCALGLSQLARLEGWIARRRVIAGLYDRELASLAGVMPLARPADRTHVFHLYVVRLDPEIDRDRVFAALRAEGIGANVHYPPLHLHSYYRARFGTREGQCPQAEAAAPCILSLPMFPAMEERDVARVCEALQRAIAG
jgi:perosamine synthetase